MVASAAKRIAPIRQQSSGAADGTGPDGAKLPGNLAEGRLALRVGLMIWFAELSGFGLLLGSGRLAQFGQGVEEVPGSDGLAEMGLAQVGQQDEADGPLVEFFIAA